MKFNIENIKTLPRGPLSSFSLPKEVIDLTGDGDEEKEPDDYSDYSDDETTTKRDATTQTDDIEPEAKRHCNAELDADIDFLLSNDELFDLFSGN